jgi:hypothetical protein
MIVPRPLFDARRALGGLLICFFALGAALCRPALAQNTAPSITNISPNLGPVGTFVTLTGTNLGGTAPTTPPTTITVTSVTLNGVACTFGNTVGNSMGVIVPNGAKSGQFVVVASTGQAISPQTFTVTGQTTISNFSPSSGKPGAQVVITGTGFTGATSVTINGVAAVFSVVSATQINAVVPNAPAGSAPIVVTSPNGTASSANLFTVLSAAPTITGINPLAGVVTGVTGSPTVTISGTNLDTVTQVQFGAATATAVPVFPTPNNGLSITVAVPTNAVSGPITVVNPAGSAVSSQSFTVTPTITNFSPAAGPIGTAVTITGTGMAGLTDVVFLGATGFNPVTVQAAGFTSLSPTQVVLNVPAGATTGKIEVQTASSVSGSATSTGTFKVTPVISSYSPASGQAPTTGVPGTTVTINGTGFDRATSVLFTTTGGTVAGTSFTVTSSTQLTVIVPSTAVTGPLTVVTPDGNATTTQFNLADFQVAPAISTSAGASVQPLFGPVGTTVTITGSGFSGATAVNFTGFNNTTVSASFTVVNANTITATVPGLAVPGAITVVTPVGSATSSQQFLVTPTVSGFTPLKGIAGGTNGLNPSATSVLISGTGFAGVVSVQLGGINAAFTINQATATSITMTVPNTALTGLIDVFTDLVKTGGKGESASQFIVLPLIAGDPAVTGVATDCNGQPSGPKGTRVDIFGSGFEPNSTVTFPSNPPGGVDGSANVVSPNHIIATVPSGAIRGLLTVTDAFGFSTFNFIPFGTDSPTPFTPVLGGPVGTTVTITGIGFADVTAVRFNSNTDPNGAPIFTAPSATGTAPFQIDSNEQITVTIPSNATTGPIEITNSLSCPFVSFASFTVTPPIINQVGGISPTSGPVGTQVTITGSGFDAVTGVGFFGVNGANTVPTSFTIVDNNHITAIVPLAATTGVIGVTSEAGTSFSTQSFFVTPAQVGSFSPTSGPVGTLVTISGNGFSGATGVQFSGPGGTFVNATTFNILSDNQITATVPAGAITGPFKVITAGTAQGSAASLQSFTVTPPVINSFSPTSGPSGTVVVITGRGFLGATGVGFGGTPASKFTVNSNTQITATVPADATTGPITVTNINGTGTSATDFTIVVPPTITGFTPSSGPAGTVVTINGNQFTGATSVQVNGVAMTGVTVNAAGTQITATVAPSSTTGPITVVTPAGTATSATNFGVTASITSFTPTSGPAGTVVTITGQGFTGATGVAFGGTAAASFTVNSNTQITATVANGTSTGPVTVTNAAGTGSSSSNFTITLPPTISSFTPTSGIAGTSVTINGANFTGATAVKFNITNAASFSVNAAGTQITAVVAAGTTTGPISVTTPSGTATTTTNFGITPTVTSFTPTSGPVGTQVVITGVNFTGATGVAFGGTPAASFTVNSNTQITATVAAGTTNGPVTVTNTGGTGTSSTNFTVTFAPTISSFTPTSGIAGTSVTINGTNFTGATAVKFNITNAASFTVNSATQITAVVAAGTTTGPITVTTPSGSATSANNFGITPTVTSFTPTSGPVGTQVVITGANFTGVTSVAFGGTNASFIVNSPTQITATVAAGTTSGPVTVTNAGGTGSSSTSFTITLPPTISSFTPTSGVAGTSVTINGANFKGATAVTFNITNAASFTVNAAGTQITAVVAAGTTTGPISVTTPSGTATSNTNFGITPTVTSFTPTSGPVGTQVVITGANFVGVTGVSFGGVPAASFTVNSSTQITATVAAGTTTGPVTVTNAGGTGSSSTNFTVPAGPTISSFTPASGTIGTTVTINGTGFSGTTAVQFTASGGLANATTFSIVSDTQLTAVVPPGATTGPIRVTATGANPGTAVSSSSFTVTPPTVTSFTPTSGPVGTQVVITGQGFLGATGVAFGGTAAASFTVNSNTQITATVAAGTTNGPVTVTNVSGTGRSTTNFNVTPGPVIVSFTPTSGPVGASVTITGANFLGATVVEFNGLAASSFTVNPVGTQITAVVPSGASTGPITVTTPNGTATSTANFGVTPTISSFTPTGGPVGTQVVITGQNFVGVTGVSFGGVQAISFTVNSSTQITATVPSGAMTGPIAVTNAAGSTSSSSNFTVAALPTISSFTPTSGPIGATVTINGTALAGATAVSFNNTKAASFTVNAAGTQITAVVATGTTTGPISVTTPSGTATTTTNFGITPTVTSFTPTSGPAGTQVVITGVNFTGATGVAFGGTNAASFTVNSNTQITATVAQGTTTGPVTVTNASGTGSSSTNFTITFGPTITSFTPTSGTAGTTVTIIGTNFTGATAVKFNITNAASFTVNSATQITAVVAAGTTTGQITVTTPSGSATTTTNFGITPTVTSFSPTSGPAGTQVVITGQNFTGATGVAFGGTPAASFIINSNTQITATVAPGTTNGPVTVTNASGTGTSSGNFTITLPPTISSFTPTSGVAGTSVTINGTNFTGATAVKFNITNAASFTVNAAGTQITAVVAAGTTTGPISVTTPSGTATSNTNFGITPTVTSFTPTSGPVGTQVVITGTNFTGATGVAFGGTPAASFTVNSNTQITATVGAGTTSGPVTVTNAGGTGSSSTNFTVPAGPTISSFTPTSGPLGTTVTITGTGFAGATDVQFPTAGGGLVSATTFSIVSDTTITAVVPAGAVTGPIRVSTVGSKPGTAVSTASFTVTPPVVSSFSPTTGPVGTTVVITGQGFLGASGVAFAGTPAASFTVNSNTQITAVVAAGTTNGPVTVTNVNGTGRSTTNFNVTPGPNIVSFTPTRGPVGTSVIITGANFLGATGVSFNGTPAASFTVNSVGTQITAVVAPNTTTGPISVTGPNGTSTSANDFTLTAAITDINPTVSPVGVSMTITGSGFTGATAVSYFGGIAAPFTVQSDTKITTLIPDNAKTGPVTVTTPSGNVASPQNYNPVPIINNFTPTTGAAGTSVTITGSGFGPATKVTFSGIQATFIINSSTQITAVVPLGASTGPITVTNAHDPAVSDAAVTATSNVNFVAITPPTISSFSPTSGTVGTPVTINGTGFNGATAVTFNGVPASSFTVVFTTGTQIIAVVPASASTGPIGVTTPNGTTQSTQFFTINVPPPVVTPSSLTTTVGGPPVTFTIALASAPTADVTVGLSSTDPSQGSISPTLLTFTPANYNVPQTVTVTPVATSTATGDVVYKINFSFASADPKYNGLSIAPVTVTNKPVSPGVTIAPLSLTTVEGGPAVPFTVKLNARPTANVTLNLSSGNTAKGTLDKTSLVFTPSNYASLQTVKVQPVDNFIVDHSVGSARIQLASPVAVNSWIAGL